jgi:hypothetical protein
MSISAIASKEVKLYIDLLSGSTGLGIGKTPIVADTATAVPANKYYVVTEHTPSATTPITWTKGTGGTTWTPSTTVSEVGKILYAGSTAGALTKGSATISVTELNVAKLENKITFQPTPTHEVIEAKNDDNPSGKIYGNTSYTCPITAHYGKNPVQSILIANTTNDSYWIFWCDRASTTANYTAVKAIGKMDKDYSQNPVQLKGELGFEGVPFEAAIDATTLPLFQL